MVGALMGQYWPRGAPLYTIATVAALPLAGRSLAHRYIMGHEYITAVALSLLNESLLHHSAEGGSPNREFAILMTCPSGWRSSVPPEDANDIMRHVSPNTYKALSIHVLHSVGHHPVHV